MQKTRLIALVGTLTFGCAGGTPRQAKEAQSPSAASGTTSEQETTEGTTVENGERTSIVRSQTSTTAVTTTTLPGDDPFEKHKDAFEKLTDDSVVQIGLVPANTGGTGGAAGLRTEKFSDGASETNFFVYTPTGAGPFGVLVFFHGDGGSPTAANFAKSTAVQAFANSDRYIVVEAAAPDGSSWWMQGGKNNAALIDAFLRTKIFKAYDVTTKKVTFAGMSGGANFIGGFLLPERGHKFRSLSILLCGGEQNIGDIFYTHEEFPKNSRLYVKIKRGDDLFDQAQRALDYYKLKGFKVTADLLDGTGHCGFNIVDAVAAAIRADR